MTSPTYTIRIGGKKRGTRKSKAAATKLAYELHKKAPNSPVLIERVRVSTKRPQKTRRITQVVKRYILIGCRLFSV